MSSSLINVTTSKSGNTRKVGADYYFYWDKAPFYTFTDAAIMGASDGYLYTSDSRNKGTATYTAYGATGSRDFTRSLSVSAYPNTAHCGYSEFAASETRANSSGQDITYYLASGYIHTTFQNTYGINQVSLHGAYIHTRLNISIYASIDITGTAGLSISADPDEAEVIGQKVSQSPIIIN